MTTRVHRVGMVIIAVILVSLLASLISGCTSPSQAPTSAPTTSQPAASTSAPTAVKPATSAPAPAKVVNWKLAHYVAKDDYRDVVSQKWADMITERSGGAIKVTVYPAAQLVKGTEQFRAVGANVAQASLCYAGYFDQEVPLFQMFGMPFPPWNTREVMSLGNDVKALLDKALKSNNVKFLGIVATAGPGGILLFKKEAKTLDDLKGRKVRGFGGAQDESMKAIGMQMVTMSAAEQYMAIQTGTVDGVCTAPASALSSKLYEVAPYFLDVRPSYGPYEMMLNLDEWNKLTAEQKAMVEKTTADIQAWAEPYELGEFAKQEAGMLVKFKRSTLSDADMAKWMEINKPIYESYVKNNGEDGKTLWAYWDKLTAAKAKK